MGVLFIKPPPTVLALSVCPTGRERTSPKLTDEAHFSVITPIGWPPRRRATTLAALSRRRVDMRDSARKVAGSLQFCNNVRQDVTYLTFWRSRVDRGDARAIVGTEHSAMRDRKKATTVSLLFRAPIILAASAFLSVSSC